MRLTVLTLRTIGIFVLLVTFSPLLAVSQNATVKFGIVEGTTLYGDLYLPQNTGSASVPAVVWVHGGGWAGGSRKGDGCTVPAGYPLFDFLVNVGIAVFSVDYRLSRLPTAGQPCPLKDPYSVNAVWPAHIQDVRTGIRWLRAHAIEYGIDPNRIAIAGESAGGNLSLVAGFAPDNIYPKTGDLSTIESQQNSKVAAIVDWYGPSDTVAYYNYLSIVNPSPHPLLPVFGGAPGTSKAIDYRYWSSSPVNFISKSGPPVRVVHGTCDYAVPFAQSNRYLASAFHQQEMTLDLVAIEGANHGFLIGCSLNQTPQKYQIAIDETVSFFKQHLF